SAPERAQNGAGRGAAADRQAILDGENADGTCPPELAVFVVPVGVEGVVQGRPMLVFVVAGAAIAAPFLPPRDDHEGVGLLQEGPAIGLYGRQALGTTGEGFIGRHGGSCGGATI